VTVLRFLRGLLAAAGLAALTFGLDACNQQSVEATLRSLQASSEVTFVCRGQRLPTGDDGEILHDRGFELSACPDFSDPRTRTTLAVITQTATNELAVVSVDDQKVIDADLSIPGYTFLRLPSRPGDIVSSPGGEASFVGLTSTGKTGIAAIPTTCLGPPRDNADGAQHARDVTTFAACSLSSAPGDMVVMVEPPLNGTIAASCAHPDEAQPTEPPPGATRDGGRDCVADLTTEGGAVGRRKLVLTLPDEGKIKVIDAQWLLDQAPGSFGPCVFEGEGLDLDVTPDVTGQSQKPPDDFPDGSCSVPQPTPPPVPPSAISQPSGLAAAADGRLFVGDLGVPAVHVLDASSPCNLRELPPLLPMSYATPSRLVTTSRVAVSPVTPSGKQYVYAVDAGDQPTTSVMAFDVSTDATERTPIMRAGSMRQPREAPDRIAFSAPIADIAFAYRDLPRSDLETGVAEIGVRCDPSPDASIDPPTPGVQYRTTGDFTQGARPQLLRGLFGLVMLTSGQIVVIDVDDFDADCRRPVSTNATEQPDFRGCARDPWLGPAGEDGTTEPYYLTYSPDDPLATRTVTGEVSCNIVEPHRARSASFGLSTPTLGLGAPSLRGFPRFDAPKSVVNSSVEDRPKLLAVPFESPMPGVEVKPQVYVGTTLHGLNGTDSELPTDPSNTKDRNSLTLPLVEPRSYPSNERNVLVYEGRVLAGDQPSGFFTQTEQADGSIVLGLDDPTAYFCNQGVYDGEAMAAYASDVLGLDDTEAGPFGTAHSDYLQITGDFPSIIDSYWDLPRGREVGGRDQCEVVFGPPPRPGATELEAARDFTITAAHQGRLEVAPRTSVLADNFPDLTVERWVTGCFPGGLRYTIRGGKQWVLANGRPDTLHDITADASRDYRCIRDCDPRKRFFRSRVFEISSTGCSAEDDQCDEVGVGAADPNEEVGPCRYEPMNSDGETRGITLAEPAAKCIFENLTARFAVYRGRQPSVRDMIFGWDTTGGFVPLSASLASISSAVLPQHLAYVPEYQAIAVVDGSTLGFSFMSLDSLRISDPWPVF
jgi:hypothetical protein